MAAENVKQPQEQPQAADAKQEVTREELKQQHKQLNDKIREADALAARTLDKATADVWQEYIDKAVGDINTKLAECDSETFAEIAEMLTKMDANMDTLLKHQREVDAERQETRTNLGMERTGNTFRIPVREGQRLVFIPANKGYTSQIAEGGMQEVTLTGGQDVIVRIQEASTGYVTRGIGRRRYTEKQTTWKEVGSATMRFATDISLGGIADIKETKQEAAVRIAAEQQAEEARLVAEAEAKAAEAKAMAIEEAKTAYADAIAQIETSGTESERFAIVEALNAAVANLSANNMSGEDIVQELMGSGDNIASIDINPNEKIHLVFDKDALRFHYNLDLGGPPSEGGDYLLRNGVEQIHSLLEEAKATHGSINNLPLCRQTLNNLQSHYEHIYNGTEPGQGPEAANQALAAWKAEMANLRNADGVPHELASSRRTDGTLLLVLTAHMSVESANPFAEDANKSVIQETQRFLDEELGKIPAEQVSEKAAPLLERMNEQYNATKAESPELAQRLLLELANEHMRTVVPIEGTDSYEQRFVTFEPSTERFDIKAIRTGAGDKFESIVSTRPQPPSSDVVLDAGGGQ